MNKSWKLLFRGVMVCAVVGVLAGCNGSRVDVAVSGFTDPTEPPRKTYVIVPEDASISPENLEYQEYSGWVEQMMSQAGFKKASSAATADLALQMSYGVSDPTTLELNNSEPIYEQSGERTVTTGSYTGKGKNKKYETSTVTEPTYNLTGYTTRTTTQIIYVHNVYLAALKMERYRLHQVDEVWRLQAKAPASWNSLKTLFPYMAVAMRPYLGKDTDVTVRQSIKVGDSRVVDLLKSSRY
jgi:hypothetical protein